MKKLLIILLIALTALTTINSCKPCKPCPGESTDAGGKKYVQYFIVVVDTLHDSPYAYYGKFNNNTHPYEITPSSVFTFTFEHPSDADSVTVKVFGQKKVDERTTTNINVIWFREGIDWSHSQCKNDTIFKTVILNGPARDAAPSVTGPTDTQPVPIGIKPPTQNNNP